MQKLLFGRAQVSNSQSAPVTAISNGMKSPKQKLTAGRLKRWRVSILRSRAHNLGMIEVPDAKAAEAEAMATNAHDLSCSSPPSDGCRLPGDVGTRMTGKTRITIYGPKDEGSYVVEVRTAGGDVLAISIPRTGLFVPDVRA